jgi:TolA-binding protein
VSRAPVGNNALVEQLKSENASLRRELNEARNDAMSNTQTERMRMNSIQYENSSMREELETLKRLIESLKEDKKSLKKDLRHAENEIEDLKEDKKSLKRSLRDRPDLPKLFHGNYDVRRENVVELSQLLSRHLEDKPKEIDSNKIYNCVRACFTDLEKGYGDNPEHYYMDMRMLLATCLACTWFTNNQQRSIEQWNKDHFC